VYNPAARGLGQADSGKPRHFRKSHRCGGGMRRVVSRLRGRHPGMPEQEQARPLYLLPKLTGIASPTDKTATWERVRVQVLIREPICKVCNLRTSTARRPQCPRPDILLDSRRACQTLGIAGREG
jgi:hypothetical protein